MSKPDVLRKTPVKDIARRFAMLSAVALLGATACQDKQELPTPTPIIEPSPFPTATIEPTLTPTPTKTPIPNTTSTLPSESVTVKSIDSMNQTKDRLRDQPSDEFITDWLTKAKEAGATHVTIDVPYDDKNTEEYITKWELPARQMSLNIWWRQMFEEFEGIYDKPVIPQGTGPNERDYTKMLENYIRSHAKQYKPGDVFSLTAEPAAGRIRGINCFNEVCTFEDKNNSGNAADEFNEWLLQNMEVAKKTFTKLGIPIQVNAGGLDLFVAIGYDNPDWGCDDPDNPKPDILYPETVEAMGGFFFDHYFQEDDTMENALDAIERCYSQSEYPELKFGIGEYGPIYGGDIEQQVKNTMAAVKAHPRFSGFYNHFQGGPAGSESLFEMGPDNKLKGTIIFDAVQQNFKTWEKQSKVEQKSYRQKNPGLTKAIRNEKTKRSFKAA